MSCLWNVLSIKCLVYEMPCLWNVLSNQMKCPVYKMLCLWNVLSNQMPYLWNLLSNQMSYLWNVLSNKMSYQIKFPVYEMSYLRNVLSIKWPNTKIELGVRKTKFKFQINKLSLSFFAHTSSHDFFHITFQILNCTF